MQWRNGRIRQIQVLANSTELLLHFLQRFNNCAQAVKQVQSVLIIDGHLLITNQWMNTLLYNALIRSYLNFARPKISLHLFVQMLHHRAPPNNHTLPSVLKAASSLSRVFSISPVCDSLNSQCVRRGLFKDPFVMTSLVSVYSHIGDLASACKVFDEIPQPCVASCNAMLNGFARGGDMTSAVSVFSSMLWRDVYSWTSMISGYVRNRRFKEAIGAFGDLMIDKDVIHGMLRPNEATFVSILSACSNLDDSAGLCLGKQIHGHVIGRGELDVLVGTALVAFYGKMGCLTCAHKMFNSMAVKQECTWNAMICSLALNGKESEALDMFDAMKLLGWQPNEVTFVGVLSACARAKLVDMGLKLFRSMWCDYGITPRMEHYGCVVDLLGKAGLLNEAYEFVASMPFQADASVLGALLGACRVHGDVSLGDEVGRRVVELQPGRCGGYVLLWSIYAEAEIWDEAVALRKAIANAGLCKVPAFSMADLV